MYSADQLNTDNIFDLINRKGAVVTVKGDLVELEGKTCSFADLMKKVINNRVIVQKSNVKSFTEFSLQKTEEFYAMSL